MLRYVDTRVCFAEIPDEITLCINLSNCPCHCEGCHSPYLAEDIGEVLTYSRLKNLVESNKGITVVCFMGGDSHPELINHYAKLLKNEVIETEWEVGNLKNNIDIDEKNIHLKKGDLIKVHKLVKSNIKVGWYSGRQKLAEEIDLDNFDFIKLGPYKKECGPLNSPTTNQKFFQVINGELVNITHKFWKHEIKNQNKEDK